MNDAERFQAEVPASPGMGTGTKILLGCSIGCGAMMLLCCGGLFATSYLGARWLQRSVIREPAEIQAIAADVAAIDVPDHLQPKAGVNMHVPIIDRTFIKAVVYTDEEQKQIVAIGEFAESLSAVDEKTLRDEIDRALEKQETRKDGDDEFRITETHSVELEIRGQPAKFRIEEGTDSHDKKLVRAFGEFPGHHGLGLVFLQLDGETHSVENVEQILRSIR